MWRIGPDTGPYLLPFSDRLFNVFLVLFSFSPVLIGSNRKWNLVKSAGAWFHSTGKRSCRTAEMARSRQQHLGLPLQLGFVFYHGGQLLDLCAVKPLLVFLQFVHLPENCTQHQFVALSINYSEKTCLHSAMGSMTHASSKRVAWEVVSCWDGWGKGTRSFTTEDSPTERGVTYITEIGVVLTSHGSRSSASIFPRKKFASLVQALRVSSGLKVALSRPQCCTGNAVQHLFCQPPPELHLNYWGLPRPTGHLGTFVVGFVIIPSSTTQPAPLPTQTPPPPPPPLPIRCCLSRSTLTQHPTGRGWWWLKLPQSSNERPSVSCWSDQDCKFDPLELSIRTGSTSFHPLNYCWTGPTCSYTDQVVSTSSTCSCRFNWLVLGQAVITTSTCSYRLNVFVG